MTTDLTTITPAQEEILWKMAEQAKVSKTQFMFMLELAKKYKLDPFARQIYATPKGIIVGRDGYLALAWRSGKFNGMKTEFVDDEKGNPIKSITTVWRKGIDQPFVEPAYWSEYHKETEVWNKYKHPMLQKCSERAALSKAFAISGLYSDAELEDIDDSDLAGDIEYVDAEVVQAPITCVEDVPQKPQQKPVEKKVETPKQEPAPATVTLPYNEYDLANPYLTLEQMADMVTDIKLTFKGQSVSKDEIDACRRQDGNFDRHAAEVLKKIKYNAFKEGQAGGKA